MEEKIQKAIDTLHEAKELIINKQTIAGVVIDHNVDDKIWVWKPRDESWFDYPVRVEKIEDAFDKVKIEEIIIRREYHGGARVKAYYKVSRYMKYKNEFVAGDCWDTLEAAVKANKAKWGKAKQKYLREQEESKQRDIKKKELELKALKSTLPTN